MSINTKNVCIVIPVHNQYELLQKCINSIYDKAGVVQFQIILVNDGSDKQTTGCCQKLYDDKIAQVIVHNKIAKGFTESCNIGIQNSKKFDYICFLNSDTKIVTKNWLDIIATYWELNQDVGSIGVLSNNATTQSVGNKIVEESKIQAYGDWITSFSNKKYPLTTFINGFCFFVSLKVIRQVGLLNSKIFPHYGSEDDYILRINKKNYKLVIADDVYVYHFSNQSYKDQRPALTKRSYPDLVKKWGSKTVRHNAFFAESVLDPLRNKILTTELETNQFCDIIIVVHNALSYLKKCIESIKKYTSNFNIIIVDNFSEEETKQYLQSLKDVILITNKQNYGFGYANNQALRESTSKYVCFLNSDVVVTQDWLQRLMSLLESSNTGLIGPVTNCVSSEIQKVDYLSDFAVDQNDDEMQLFSQKQYSSFEDKLIEVNRLVGFCFLMKREIINEIGCFDERYKFNFEDDDLCLRVIESGYKVFCALGVFIYHFGSKSFEKKGRFFNDTIEDSKKKHLEKWYDSKRIERINENKSKFSIIYILTTNNPCGGVKVVFEHANRLKNRGYDIAIWCNKDVMCSWFDVQVPVFYFNDYTEIPEVDIAIGTYFPTLSVLQNIKAKIKLHFCQGYEALVYNEKKDMLLIETIKEHYKKIKEKIVVSTWLKDLMYDEYKIDCHYVPNGIDQYVFSLKSHKRNKKNRILVVGDYDLQFKGVRFAIQSLKDYSKFAQFSLVRLASQRSHYDVNCEFHDMTKMSQQEIASVYASCDVTINSSLKVEGFSLPPLESMASGTPVITTDCGGVNDYAINKQNCLIVSPGSSDAILQALKKLLGDSSFYSKLVEQGLKTANMYLWYKKIDMLEGLLHNLYQNYLDSQKERLSVCMIIKNEEKCLEKCLESIKEIASEIIIVDTGSTDESIIISKKFGAKIYHFKWCNDFSAARNFSLSKATQPWTLVLDADETISKVDIEKLRNILKGSKNAYCFSTRNYVNVKEAEGLNINSGEYEFEEKGYVGWCKSDKIRLFPTNNEIRFEGVIHELVEKSIENIDIEVKLSLVPIHHYSNFSSSKNSSYLELSKQKDLLARDPKSLFELATQYLVLTNYDQAIVIWRRLLELQPENEEVLAHLGTTYNLIDDFSEAEKYFKESIDIKGTEYAIKHLGICYAKQNKISEAYHAFKKIAYKTNDFKTKTDFAYCCNQLGRHDEAITILEKCLKINKDQTISTGLLEIAYNDKGTDLANKQKFQKSVNMFRSALAINPNFKLAKENIYTVSKVIHSSRFSKKFIN